MPWDPAQDTPLLVVALTAERQPTVWVVRWKLHGSWPVLNHYLVEVLTVQDRRRVLLTSTQEGVYYVPCALELMDDVGRPGGDLLIRVATVDYCAKVSAWAELLLPAPVPAPASDPAVGLTPASESSLQQWAAAAVAARRAGGPIPEALKNLAHGLPENTLDALDMAADGSDLRQWRYSSSTGVRLETVWLANFIYHWDPAASRYVRDRAERQSTALAEMPAPQSPTPKPTRRIILED